MHRSFQALAGGLISAIIIVIRKKSPINGEFNWIWKLFKCIYQKDFHPLKTLSSCSIFCPDSKPWIIFKSHLWYLTVQRLPTFKFLTALSRYYWHHNYAYLECAIWYFDICVYPWNRHHNQDKGHIHSHPQCFNLFPHPSPTPWPPRNGFGALWQSNPASKTPQRKTAKVLPYSGVLLDFNGHQ